MRGWVEGCGAVVPGEPHFEVASVTIAEVIDALRPGDRFAHTAIDHISPEPAWCLGQDDAQALLRRAHLIDIDRHVGTERLGKFEAVGWSAHHNGPGRAG